MYDLIYTGNHNDYKEIEELIKKEYPQAKIEDGSDYIHEHRFSVEFEIEQEDWFTFIIHKGFAMCSLNFQLVAMKEPDRIIKLVERKKDNKIARDCKYYKGKCPKEAICPSGAFCHKQGGNK